MNKPANIFEANDENFEALTAEGIVIVDFHATWCQPCKMLTPILEEIAKEDENIKIVKADVDVAKDAAIENQVNAVPMIIIMKDGEEIKKLAGLQPKKSIDKVLETLR